MLVLGTCAEGPDRVKGARHVILISMDTSRADHFGFMGNNDAKTPRMDEMAEESIVFADFMTVVPTTLASHTSLFTGKYPHHHGAARNGYVVNGENVMLPEILKEAGFHTAGFVGSFVLSSRFDFSQGFDYYDDTFGIPAGQGGTEQTERSAADVTDAAIRYLDGIEVPRRMFLFVHYFDPHRPYAAPAPFDKAFDPRGREGLPQLAVIMRDTTLTEAERLAHARRQELQYASEIAYMDHHIGRLLDDLRDRGILEESFVLVTSDHGENLLDHYMRFDHGHRVFQSTVKAVLVIRLPGGGESRVLVKQLVGSVDVLPTLLEFLGLTVPSKIDGQAVDLSSVGELFPGRMRFSQATRPHGDFERGTPWPNTHKSRCVRKGEYKFIQNPLVGTEELYNVLSDPGEQTNLLLSPLPGTEILTTELRRELETWVDSADPLPSRFENLETEDSIRKLRGLGYIK